MNGKILERVKQLLAIAEHKNANPHEAELAASRAQSLITRHGIEQAMLQDTQDKKEPIIKKVVFYCDRVEKYKQYLAQGVAVANNCQTFYSPGHSVTIYGHETNVELSIPLYELLLTQVMHWGIREGRGQGHIYANSYRTGLVTRITQRLKESKEEVKRQATDPQHVIKKAIEEGESVNQALEAMPKVTNAIALYNSQPEEVVQWRQKNLRLSKGIGSKSKTNYHAYQRGRARGNSVNLSNRKRPS